MIFIFDTSGSIEKKKSIFRTKFDVKMDVAWQHLQFGLGTIFDNNLITCCYIQIENDTIHKKSEEKNNDDFSKENLLEPFLCFS